MDVAMLREGLWRWTAPHPEWTPDQDWPQQVGCVYYEAPEAVVLVDPLVPPGEEAERFWRALDRDVERLGRPVWIGVTVRWHERSVEAVAARYGAAVWRHGDAAPLPAGVEGVAVDAAGETVLYFAEHAAAVPGDVLVAASELALCPASWLPEGRSLAEVRDALAPLLSRRLELVLVSHGEPVVDRAGEALARALADARS